MDRDPYSAPKSNVRDVSPEPARHRIRTKWLYLCLVAPLLYATYAVWDVLLPSLTVAAVGAGLALAVLIAISPLQALLARRSGSSPWWWDVLFCGLIGTAVLGSLVDDPILIVVGFVPGLALIAVVVLGTWVIEARHCVRIYSKARGFVFVEARDGY